MVGNVLEMESLVERHLVQQMNHAASLEKQYRNYSLFRMYNIGYWAQIISLISK